MPWARRNDIVIPEFSHSRLSLDLGEDEASGKDHLFAISPWNGLEKSMQNVNKLSNKVLNKQTQKVNNIDTCFVDSLDHCSQLLANFHIRTKLLNSNKDLCEKYLSHIPQNKPTPKVKKTEINLFTKYLFDCTTIYIIHIFE